MCIWSEHRSLLYHSTMPDCFHELLQCRGEHWLMLPSQEITKNYYRIELVCYVRLSWCPDYKVLDMIYRTVCLPTKIDAVPMLVLTLPATFVSSFTKVIDALINDIPTHLRLLNDHLHNAVCAFAVKTAAGNATFVTLRRFVCLCCSHLQVNHSHCFVFRTFYAFQPRAAEKKNWMSGVKQVQLCDAFDVASSWHADKTKVCFIPKIALLESYLHRF